jgi:RNA polymerase sigma-54 factor
MEMKLVAKMQLGTVITPQLKMAIKLLTLNHLELKDAVAQELIENPVLEEAMDDPKGPTEAREAESVTPTTNDVQGEVTPEQGPKDEGIDWEAFADSYNYLPGSAGGAAVGADGEEMPGIEQTFSRGETLEEHLLWQIRMSDMSDLQRQIAIRLLGEMNDAGFLDCAPVQVQPAVVDVPAKPKVDPRDNDGDSEDGDDSDDSDDGKGVSAHEEVPASTALIDPVAMIADDMDIPYEWVEAVRRRVTRMDPIGVLSTGLQECLLIQLEIWGYDEDTIPYLVVKHHLRDAERKNYHVIQKALRCSMEDIGVAMKIVEQLEPRPGRNFLAQGRSDSAEHITPDAYVRKVGGEWVVTLNDDGIPRLRMSPFYIDKLRQDARARMLAKAKGERVAADPSRTFISEKKRNAEWLIKSLHQRQRTIFRVVESIVRHQRDWFDHAGPLKPLILKQVADDIEMTPGKTIHESTVSRVTTRKYMQTPRGIFELKYFFNSMINTGDGDNIASESVKDEIRRIIADENTKKPFSDQTIVAMLQKKNIEIARRTVAKYREMLGILPSSQRKQVF